MDTNTMTYEVEQYIRRHMLAERFLVDILGLPWADVHEEADRIANAISARVEERLRVVLGDPGTCPHGNPIPGVPHAPDQSAALPLLEALGPVVVTRVADQVEHNVAAMRLLASCGLTPGQQVDVRGRMHGGTSVVTGQQQSIIPDSVARHTFVTPT